MCYPDVSFIGFLQQGRGDTDCFALARQQVEEIIRKLCSLNRNFDKQVFRQLIRRKSNLAGSIHIFHLLLDGCFRQVKCLKLFEIEGLLIQNLAFAVFQCKQKQCVGSLLGSSRRG